MRSTAVIAKGTKLPRSGSNAAYCSRAEEESFRQTDSIARPILLNSTMCSVFAGDAKTLFAASSAISNRPVPPPALATTGITIAVSAR